MRNKVDMEWEWSVNGRPRRVRRVVLVVMEEIGRKARTQEKRGKKEKKRLNTGYENERR